jgi:hypothetical protein
MEDLYGNRYESISQSIPVVFSEVFSSVRSRMSSSQEEFLLHNRIVDKRGDPLYYIYTNGICEYRISLYMEDLYRNRYESIYKEM